MWGGKKQNDNRSINHKVMTRNSLRVDFFSFHFKPSMSKWNRVAMGLLLEGVFEVGDLSRRRSLRCKPCWCQTGIGFESRYQRAFIVHGYICLIDVFSAAHSQPPCLSIRIQIFISGFIQRYIEKSRPITVVQNKEIIFILLLKCKW